jgi:hypothetical protein
MVLYDKGKTMMVFRHEFHDALNISILQGGQLFRTMVQANESFANRWLEISLWQCNRSDFVRTPSQASRTTNFLQTWRPGKTPRFYIFWRSTRL